MTDFHITDDDSTDDSTDSGDPTDHDLLIACHGGGIGVTMSGDYSADELERFGEDILRYLGSNYPWKHELADALDDNPNVVDHEHYHYGELPRDFDPRS